jgi:long-chain fatty acid transport protein
VAYGCNYAIYTAAFPQLFWDVTNESLQIGFSPVCFPARVRGLYGSKLDWSTLSLKENSYLNLKDSNLMSFNRKLLLSSLLLTISANAQATNGYFTHGLGVINKGMAGAGTATPEEAMAIANNPASAVLLGDSRQVGLSIFSPRRQYTASDSLANGNGGAFTIGPGKVESGSNYFPIPYFARTWSRSDDSALGMAIYGRGGMNTDYSGGSAIFDPDGPGPAPVMQLDGPYGAGKAGVDLNQLFAEIAWAGKLNETFSWGISGIFTAQAFKARGLGSFAPYTSTFAASGGTVMPRHLTDNGTDYSTGFGGKFGVQWQASERLRMGISYQSRIYMAEFDKYSDLFAAQGGFDIPPNIRLGISWDYSERITFHYDTDHTNYGEVASVGNPIANIFNCPTAGAGGTQLEYCLGGDRGAGFGWNDVTVHKLGFSWRPQGLENWTLRAGLSHAQQPIEPSEVLFNMLAPGVIERHFTLGATHSLRNGRALSVMFMYAPAAKVTGRNTFDPTQNIQLKMHQYELEFGYSW